MWRRLLIVRPCRPRPGRRHYLWLSSLSRTENCEIHVIVSAGGHVKLCGGSARYCRYWMKFEVKSALDTRLCGGTRKQVQFAFGTLATSLVNECHVVTQRRHVFASLRRVVFSPIRCGLFCEFKNFRDPFYPLARRRARSLRLSARRMFCLLESIL